MTVSGMKNTGVKRPNLDVKIYETNLGSETTVKTSNVVNNSSKKEAKLHRFNAVPKDQQSH